MHARSNIHLATTQREPREKSTNSTSTGKSLNKELRTHQELTFDQKDRYGFREENSSLCLCTSCRLQMEDWQEKKKELPE